MSESENNRITALKKEIVQLTNDYWSATGKAFLLASLGQQLTKRGYDLRTDLRGQKLVPFLQTQLVDQLVVLTSPIDPLVRGVVPKGKETEKDIHALFIRNVQEESARINLDRRIWIAFSRPVTPNHVRVVEIEPEIVFTDVPTEAASQTDKLVIPSELVIPPGSKPSEIRNAELQKNIRGWLEKHGVDISKATAKPTIEITRPSDSSVLGSLLAALDKKDLERVVIPLDIVAKLLAKRSGRG